MTDADKIQALQTQCDAADAVISDTRSADIRRQAEIAALAQQLQTSQEQNELLRAALVAWDQQMKDLWAYEGEEDPFKLVYVRLHNLGHGDVLEAVGIEIP